MKLKDLFDKAENGVLTYEQLETAMKEAKANFVDLSEGGYVSKHKHDDEITARDAQITTLNDTITKRDADLADLKGKLKNAGTDATKLAELSTNFDTLQTKYDNDIKDYQNKLAKQAYEFAVKEFAGTKKFTSNAAKRDFIQEMLSKDLKMEKDKILGADDFVTAYSANNADAFVVEETPKNDDKPTFVNPTPGPNNNPPENAFLNAFHFTGVRPMTDNK